jgi:2-polyprenyl-3-methyl-5-hydroxy-6-metoxy-1,4-benzoquinol methylase
MSKFCEACNLEIPEDYINLLCDNCYKKAEIENARIKVLQEEERKTDYLPPTTEEPLKSPIIEQNGASTGISDPNYKENPEAEDKEQWKTNIMLFDRHGVLLWKPTKSIYTFIKNYCLNKVTQHPQYPKMIWRPKIVDVGCGLGCGSNILSQEADFVWGIDKNKKTIEFAKQAFERVKNGIYYSSEIKFDNIDIMTDNRETMKFDLVCAIELVEHIADHQTFLTNLIKKFDKRKPEDPTEYFISTPNRNNKHIGQEQPTNKYHTKEWTATEFLNVLSQFFSKIELFNSAGIPIPIEEYKTTTHTPLLAKVSNPKIWK